MIPTHHFSTWIYTTADHADIYLQFLNALEISPEDDQSILIETLSCNLQFFSELHVITTQLRDFHMVPPQVVLLNIFLTMQSYKFYLPKTFVCVFSNMRAFFRQLVSLLLLTNFTQITKY